MRRRLFSAPTVCNVEITEACNLSCTHCYNHFRPAGDTRKQMNLETMERLVNSLAEAGVFHVILSGGEPFTNFGVLLHGLRLLREKNISFSCNSNLILATEERMQRLADAGLDHILTSLNSCRPDVNDAMVNGRNTLDKIGEGIGLARTQGIRVSANMIVARANRDHVHETGRLAAELGCQKLFATRTVPPERTQNLRQSSFHMEGEETLAMLEQLLRVKQDFGLMIGTLVSYPLCLLGDLERFGDLVGRGCPAQSGHAMNISVTGDCTPCVHQSHGNGNIFSEDIRAVYARMHAWHDGTHTHEACANCRYLGICRSGCRSFAHAYTGSLAGRDPLMVGPHNFSKHFELIRDPKIVERIRQGARLFVPERLRFRKEEDFYLLNIRWANTITCPEPIARQLLALRRGTFFTAWEIGLEHVEVLAQLYWKDALESPDMQMSGTRDKLGLSAGISL